MYLQTIAHRQPLSYAQSGIPRELAGPRRHDRRIRYHKDLVTPCLAALDGDTRSGDAESRGKLPCHILVCPAVDGRRSGFDMQSPVAHSLDFAATPPRVHANGNDDNRFPVVADCQAKCPYGRYMGTGLYVCSTISAAFRKTMAKIGDTSMPPIAGTIRRNGRSTGSAIVCKSTVIGL